MTKYDLSHRSRVPFERRDATDAHASLGTEPSTVGTFEESDEPLEHARDSDPRVRDDFDY